MHMVAAWWLPHPPSLPSSRCCTVLCCALPVAAACLRRQTLEGRLEALEAKKAAAGRGREKPAAAEGQEGGAEAADCTAAAPSEKLQVTQ